MASLQLDKLTGCWNQNINSSEHVRSFRWIDPRKLFLIH